MKDGSGVEQVGEVVGVRSEKVLVRYKVAENAAAIPDEWLSFTSDRIISDGSSSFTTGDITMTNFRGAVITTLRMNAHQYGPAEVYLVAAVLTVSLAYLSG